MQTRLQTAARPVSGEPSETGDHALFSMDDPAQLPKSHARKYTSTGEKGRWFRSTYE